MSDNDKVMSAEKRITWRIIYPPREQLLVLGTPWEDRIVELTMPDGSIKHMKIVRNQSGRA